MRIPPPTRRLCLAFALLSAGSVFAADYAYQPAPITRVRLLDGFWLSRAETNRLVTVWANFGKCEETGRIANFARAGQLESGPFQGTAWNDSDVFKVIEGAAHTLATHPDPKLDGYLDRLIVRIAAAQEPDGYLYTARTLGATNEMTGPARWSNVQSSHELYNLGHLFEAAVAHHAATGKRMLLDVACKSADLVCRVFGPGPEQRKDVPGHEEIEIGLCKLYRATGERRYLDLATFFVAMRGRKDLRGRVFGPTYQDHLPVLEQSEAVGHAVRAGYLYAGIADVAALTGDTAYLAAIDRLWENTVSKKLHLSGGIGARRSGEAFGENYELPNETAYLETCAAIANALWNQRMFLLHGDARYIDVLERVIYNGFLSGISLSGDTFFYPNPLESRGGYARSKWFGCSCCPVNIVRFIPQIATFAYAQRDATIFVNLFLASEARLTTPAGDVTLTQKTDYPWRGKVRIEVTPSRDGLAFPLRIRVPGWATGQPVPSDLYTQTRPATPEAVSLSLNESPVPVRIESGYVTLDRAWKKGDAVTLTLAMPVRRIRAHDAVRDNRGRLAVERGPLLYCAEGVDNNGRARSLTLAPEAVFSEASLSLSEHTVTALQTTGSRVTANLRGKRTVQPAAIILIPYYAWCHRGAGEMQTWFPTGVAEADPMSDFHITASHCYVKDSPEAAIDGVLPKHSHDNTINRMTWWPRKGSEEWLQVDFPEEESVCGSQVYWFDDTGKGACRLPVSWRIQYADADGGWRDVATEYPVAEDRFCEARFSQPVRARRFRLSVRLQTDFSGGVLEWRLLPE
ncbi:MAG TPA: glycoside hydrolase family 127 protein [Kiritimatiellia bacterium]|nr:glycoside hydrolase family 127 protein [Kiritimatiellia bacterium]